MVAETLLWAVFCRSWFNIAPWRSAFAAVTTPPTPSYSTGAVVTRLNRTSSETSRTPIDAPHHPSTTQAPPAPYTPPKHHPHPIHHPSTTRTLYTTQVPAALYTPPKHHPHPIHHPSTTRTLYPTQAPPAPYTPPKHHPHPIPHPSSTLFRRI